MDREEDIRLTTGGGYNGSVVVVPTRNRAQIAMNAIRSVLDQPVDNVQILVSDNSTSERDCEDLASFCLKLADSRLRYVRPPESLSMSAHWQWAIEQALSFYSASHFIYLTDRMMFRTGALREILDLAALYPHKIISYNHDRIVDHLRPIRIEQYPATEKLLEVDTLRFSWLFSQGIFSHALPRMLNCVAPREVLARMQQSFGNVFASIAPDFNFCFRCLEIEDSILFYDKALIFHYALDRSNGASVTRGELTSDNADFTANLPVEESNRNYATPIPQLNTAVNSAFNEYLILKRETNSPLFFEVNLQNYLKVNAAEINQVIDSDLKAAMLGLLVSHGYEASRNGPPAGFSGLAALRRRISEVLNNLKPGKNDVEFAQLEEAIDYAKNISRGNFQNWSGDAEILQARELQLPRTRTKSDK